MPNRIIKESVCRSDTIDSLSWFEEVFFYRLIVVCDDYGRFDGRPAIIKGACFPLKEDITKKHISEAIEKLSTVGLIRGYEVLGRPYLQLTTWNCHQQIRAKKSKYPAPDDSSWNQSPGGSDTGFRNQNSQDDAAFHHLISDDIKCPRNRESKYENRESYSGNRDTCVRETGEVRRFGDFLSAYPKDCNRYLTEHEYASLVTDGKVTEDDLVQCALNYAESCRILETQERYMKNAENFLRELVFDRYLPGKYKKPEAKKTRNTFHNFEQRDTDYDAMVLEQVKSWACRE